MAYNPNRLAWPRLTGGLVIISLLLIVTLVLITGCSGNSAQPAPTPIARTGVPVGVTVQVPGQIVPAAMPTPGAYPEPTMPTSGPYPVPTK